MFTVTWAAHLFSALPTLIAMSLTLSLLAASALIYTENRGPTLTMTWLWWMRRVGFGEGCTTAAQNPQYFNHLCVWFGQGKPRTLKRVTKRGHKTINKRDNQDQTKIQLCERTIEEGSVIQQFKVDCCHLDLCPRPVDPRKSEGSVESEDYDAIQQWASDGTVTAKSEPLPHCDCGKCRHDWVREKEESSRLETWMRSDKKTSFNSYGPVVSRYMDRFETL